MTLHIVLYEPEIPPNTGNVIRLCANTGATLHLIEPLGFQLEEKALRRAGLDYIEWERIHVHPNFQHFLSDAKPRTCYAFSTKATRCYTDAIFQTNDALVFGPETRGLPDDVRESMMPLRLPMQQGSRSLNLSNTVAIGLYEAWRQLHFSPL